MLDIKTKIRPVIPNKTAIIIGCLCPFSRKGGLRDFPKNKSSLNCKWALPYYTDSKDMTLSLPFRPISTVRATFTVHESQLIQFDLIINASILRYQYLP